MDLTQIIDVAAQLTGAKHSTVALAVPLIIFGSRALGKAIPDKKKGVLGFARKVFKTIGMYVPNNRGENFSFSADESTRS